MTNSQVNILFALTNVYLANRHFAMAQFDLPSSQKAEPLWMKIIYFCFLAEFRGFFVV